MNQYTCISKSEKNCYHWNVCLNGGYSDWMMFYTSKPVYTFFGYIFYCKSVQLPQESFARSKGLAKGKHILLINFKVCIH